MKDKPIILNQDWLDKRVTKALRWGISGAEAATLSSPSPLRIERAKADAVIATQSLILQSQIEAVISGDQTPINWEKLWNLTETTLTC